MTGSARACRELAYRESGGISVRLCWHAPGDLIFVEVHDYREGEHFVVSPPNHEALRAFYHPYAATSRVATSPAAVLHGRRP